MANLPKEFKVRTTSKEQSKMIINTLVNLGYCNPRNFIGSSLSGCYAISNNEIESGSVVSNDLEISFEEFIRLSTQEQILEIY